MNNTELSYIIETLKTAFDGKPWYGISMMEKLHQLKWQTVNNKIYGDKTIAILVQHITNWRIFVLKKLAGDLTFNIIIDGENDWDEVYINNHQEWIQLIEKLQATQNNLIQKLSKETDALLQKQVPGKDYTFGPILTSISQHDIYHLGQIAMLSSFNKSCLRNKNK